MEAVLSATAHPDQSPVNADRQQQPTALFPVLCAVVMCAAAFWNTVDINYGVRSGEEQVGLDFQVAIKLVIAFAAAAIGFWGLLNSPRVRGALLGVPGIALVILAVVFLATSVVALPQVANVCRAAALIYVAYLVFIPTSLATLGLRGMVIATLIGLTANVILNWGVYLFVPSIGVFEEQLSGNTFIQRMGGLGHPNSIGRTGVLAGLLSLTMLRSRALVPNWPGSRTLLFAIIVMSVATSAATLSRTSIVAGLAAAAFLMLDWLVTRRGIAVIIVGVATLAIALFSIELVTGGDVIGKFLLSAGTKTGEVQELTSATGRTEIWAATVALIAERPITGWGLNSAPILLNDFSQHPHNLLLHATLSGGIFAGLLVAALLVWNFFLGLTSGEPLIRAVSMYVLISGVFEDTCLDTFASPSTLLWLIVMLYPALSAGFRPHGLPIENESILSYNEPDGTA